MEERVCCLSPGGRGYRSKGQTGPWWHGTPVLNKLTLYVGLRSKNTHSLKSAFTNRYLFSSLPFKRKTCQSVMRVTLLNYKILNLRCAVKRLVSTQGSERKPPNGKNLQGFQWIRTSSSSSFSLWVCLPSGLGWWSTCIFFWQQSKACGILVPLPEIEPEPLAMRGQSPNHCTARGFQTCIFWDLRQRCCGLERLTSLAEFKQMLPEFWNCE